MSDRLPLQQELDRLATEAGTNLGRIHAQEQWRQLLGNALPTAVLAAAAYALLQLVARLGHVAAIRWPIAVGMALVLLAYAVRLFQLKLQAGKAATISRGRALNEWDRQLALADRLAAADEFLQREQPSPFMQAAIADAEAHLDRTKDARLVFQTPSRAGRWWSPLVATAMCLVVGLLLAQWQDPLSSPPPSLTAELPTPRAELGDRPEAEDLQAPPRQVAATKRPRPERKPSTEAATAETHAASRSEGQEERKSRGDIGSGRSSAAESSTGAGNAQGSPSQQGQISKPGERKKSQTKAKPPQPNRPQDQEKARKTDEQESGSTAGRGSSRGSNKNPAASDWSSKDHVNTPDDQDLDQENEVDDEDEEQEARGGMQPTMRDRKPPVSRDLSIGFGNQKSDDAKGRGGPSQQKKSRGTASLVLGVPIPDRVKGQPNPGKTKITQERVQPQPEPLVGGEAEARLARSTPASALRREPLVPWMTRVVRDYFLRIRQQEP